jgi:FkbH-like protein
MTLLEALELSRRRTSEQAPEANLFLVCGFTPLHLPTFLTAELRRIWPESRVAVQTGLFGDLAGNMERVGSSAACSVVVVEWGDLDPRLAIRTLGGWKPSALADIVESAAHAAARIEKGLKALALRVPTVLCMPTLPLPPLFSTRPMQAGPSEAKLRSVVSSLAASVAEFPGVQIVNGQLLDELSAPAGRYDFKSDIVYGFPYTLPHASALAEMLANLIHRPQPKKGLITDLDDTLWAGIAGEDGVGRLSWSLERGHAHGLYQQFLGSLAGAGVLIGVASKNDPTVVDRAFDRPDLLLTRNDVFPFETTWSRKSESVERILTTWNIGADAVVFVDDSPMEVAEVQAAFPLMECVVFPKDNYKEIWGLLKHLRDVFGKQSLTEEDSIRLRTIREAGARRSAEVSGGLSLDEFLRGCEARVAFEPVPPDDARTFELLNKTNQFNLNGRRFSESELRAGAREPGSLLLAVSYKDKFGPLGKIAVILGRVTGSTLRVYAWVMSCRAFSRRIEHQCLKYLFESLGIEEIAFDYQATPKNGPLQEFFAELLGAPPLPPLTLSKRHFEARTPALFHSVQAACHV